MVRYNASLCEDINGALYTCYSYIIHYRYQGVCVKFCKQVVKTVYV